MAILVPTSTALTSSRYWSPITVNPDAFFNESSRTVRDIMVLPVGTDPDVFFFRAGRWFWSLITGLHPLPVRKFMDGATHAPRGGDSGLVEVGCQTATGKFNFQQWAHYRIKIHKLVRPDPEKGHRQVDVHTTRTERLVKTRQELVIFQGFWLDGTLENIPDIAYCVVFAFILLTYETGGHVVQQRYTIKVFWACRAESKLLPEGTGNGEAVFLPDAAVHHTDERERIDFGHQPAASAGFLFHEGSNGETLLPQ